MHTLTQLPGTTRRRYQDGDVNTAPHITIAQRSRLRRELRVRKATAETQDGTQIDDDPKSEAGKRPIALPGGLRTDIEIHLTRYAQPGLDDRLFAGPQVASLVGAISTGSGSER